MSRPHLARKFIALLCGALTVAPVWSQQPRDAGTLLREQPKPPAPIPSPAPATQADSASSVPESGPTVVVKAFVFEGALLIPQEELQAVLAEHIGKELKFGQLQALTRVISAYYAQRGFLARTILPPQAVKDGVVRMRVIEGRRGKLIIRPDNERLQVDRMHALIMNRLGPDETLDLIRLGDALNLLNEQPGVSAKATLAPGSAKRVIDIVVSAASKPLWERAFELNNQGSRGTGYYQAQTSLSLINPTGHFDRASLLMNVAEGSSYARLDYSTLVHSSGLRMGMNVSGMRYHLIANDLQALDSRGRAGTAGFKLSYPLVRQQKFDLTLLGAYDHKRLIDDSIAGEVSNRRVAVSTLGLQGRLEPGPGNPMAGGFLNFGASLHLGDSQQRNAAALVSDSATRRIDGGYTKLAYQLAYARPLSPQWQVNVNFNGQAASQNLDSSEGFSLGGAYGVRGYPSGEANGDEGWLLNIDARHFMGPQLAASVFFDAGGIRLNRHTWSGWNAGSPELKNRYALFGVGAGIDWRWGACCLLRTAVGVPVGRNPGRDINQDNVDGHGNRAHLWLTLNAEI